MKIHWNNPIDCLCSLIWLLSVHLSSLPDDNFKLLLQWSPRTNSASVSDWTERERSQRTRSNQIENLMSQWSIFFPWLFSAFGTFMGYIVWYSFPFHINSFFNGTKIYWFRLYYYFSSFPQKVLTFFFFLKVKIMWILSKIRRKWSKKKKRINLNWALFREICTLKLIPPFGKFLGTELVLNIGNRGIFFLQWATIILEIGIGKLSIPR